MDRENERLTSLQKCVDMVLLKLKEADISAHSKPDELKTLFKQALSLKHPYWEINTDCDRLTKLGLIFKPQQAYSQKGKSIYVGLSFEDIGILIDIEQQHGRTPDNSFEVPYQMMLDAWDEFADSILAIFNRALSWANGNRRNNDELLDG